MNNRFFPLTTPDNRLKIYIQICSIDTFRSYYFFRATRCNSRQRAGSGSGLFPPLRDVDPSLAEVLELGLGRLVALHDPQHQLVHLVLPLLTEVSTTVDR